MKLPNRLTLTRIVLAFLMTALLTADGLPYGKTMALLVFLAAAATDYADGWLARRLGHITHFGQLMDPLADKVLVSAAFICFVAMREIVPAWIVILIISREFLVTGLRLLAARQGQTISAGVWGKHKTVWQLIVIVVVIGGLALEEDLLPLCVPRAELPHVIESFRAYFSVVTYGASVFAVFITLLSGVIYAREHRGIFTDDL